MIGKLLNDYDNKANRIPGEKLSSGLPWSEEEKTLNRFQDMFVGFIKSNGQPVGLPIDLGFVGFELDANNNPQIALTKVGAQFAAITNPVIDSKKLQFETTLSDEEIDFYLSYIGRWMPLEQRLYSIIISSINKEKNTPEQLDSILKGELSEEGFGEKGLTSERAGLLSRLTELGMINRRRFGFKVFYGLTSKGKKFLDTIGGELH